VEHSVDYDRLPYCYVAWPERGGLEVLTRDQWGRTLTRGHSSHA
jgi:hypothetical protein